jgi:hypothetical protein
MAITTSNSISVNPEMRRRAIRHLEEMSTKPQRRDSACEKTVKTEYFQNGSAFTISILSGIRQAKLATPVV